jgi:hypothetical protein
MAARRSGGMDHGGGLSQGHPQRLGTDDLGAEIPGRKAPHVALTPDNEGDNADDSVSAEKPKTQKKSAPRGEALNDRRSR